MMNIIADNNYIFVLNNLIFAEIKPLYVITTSKT